MAGVVRLVFAMGALPPRRRGEGPDAVCEPLPLPVPEGVPGARADHGGCGQAPGLRDVLQAAVR
ncbi:hypothetical protein [Amycolatopsis thermoflava]|uniref:hypothetical protein n=1 Tax=Amycolatopsis thermoflava TaxID=84480 RepID=UPI000F4BC9F4|nr:hypothetical protein [Amycolatopsis thermoflava]